MYVTLGSGSEVAEAELTHAQCSPGTWGLEADADRQQAAGGTLRQTHVECFDLVICDRGGEGKCAKLC